MLIAAHTKINRPNHNHSIIHTILYRTSVLQISAKSVISNIKRKGVLLLWQSKTHPDNSSESETMFV